MTTKWYEVTITTNDPANAPIEDDVQEAIELHLPPGTTVGVKEVEK